MKMICRVMIALVALSAVSVANAVPIQFNFVGSVASAEPVPNAFGLGIGDPIFGTAFLPDADLIGAHTYTPDDGLLQLSFTIGTVSFVETQDFGYDEFPTLTTIDGALAGLNFFVLDSEFLFSAFDGTWSASFFSPDGLMEELAGTFGVAPVSVPEPGTLALFVVSLVGMLVARRRNRRQLARS